MHPDRLKEYLAAEFEKSMNKISHLTPPFTPYGWDNGQPIYHPDPIKNQQIIDKVNGN